jgi:uncharacterized protein YwgA
MIEKFRWLAGVVAAHGDRRVIGRTRLQKTVKLLQRKGLPTNFRYTIFFYGPYSEGLHSDIGLLDRLGLVHEEQKTAHDGTTYYVLTATEEADLPDLDPYRRWLAKIEAAKPVPLELAATYDAFREMGSDHAQAIERLRRKKGSKCENGNEESALALLRELELPTD